MEIGSVYEIDPKQVERAGWEPGMELQLDGVLKYKKQNIVYTASGREAIALALYSLEKENSLVCKKCLMPAYMCDTVFLPFEQLGWELVFYHIGTDMKANEQELYRLIEDQKPGMLFIHPYYGVNTWKEFCMSLAKYQEEGLVLMEDVTQSYYLQKTYEPDEGDMRAAVWGADYVVGSLRKWYAVPDGGFVVTNRPLFREVVEHDDSFSRRRLCMLMEKWEYLKASQNRQGFDAVEKQRWVETVLPQLVQKKEAYLTVNRQLEGELDQNKKITEMSRLSENMLRFVDEKECEMNRNANYRILQEGLQNKKSIKLVFPICEETAAPLYLPVYMENRDALQQYLRKRDIYVPVLWPIGKENADCLSGDEQYIYSHIAAIPMDQRYGKKEMERILEVIEEYESL